MIAVTLADFELGICGAVIRIVGISVIVVMLWSRANKHLQVPI